MARPGIRPFDVHKAATALVEQGINPTVDHVRDRLGTGSKSTIAPLLKEWKAAQNNIDTVKNTGLPSALIATVKALYDGMQSQAQAKIDDAKAIATRALEQAEKTIADKDIQVAHLQQQLDEKSELLKTTNEQVQVLTADLNTASTLSVQLTEQLTASKEQITAANKENATLAQLNKQSQENLVHYRESVQTQRAQERADTERQINNLENALKSAQQESMRHVQHATSLMSVTKEQQKTIGSLNINIHSLDKQNALQNATIEINKTEIEQLNIAKKIDDEKIKTLSTDIEIHRQDIRSLEHANEMIITRQKKSDEATARLAATLEMTKDELIFNKQEVTRLNSELKMVLKNSNHGRSKQIKNET